MNGYKIAVIGDRESVMGFRALGLDVFPADEESAKEVFKRVIPSEQGPGYAIVYITEELTIPLRAEIDALKDELIPAIIPIPSKNGTLNLGMTALNHAVERAVGSNIL
jgi:V/A-type H+-transporting ATPase subunit F